MAEDGGDGGVLQRNLAGAGLRTELLGLADDAQSSPLQLCLHHWQHIRDTYGVVKIDR